jgi:membrane protein DedA with SNARE-associated domain
MDDWVIRVVERMGYWGIALLTLLENVFPPVPSEVIMPLAGFVSARGGMSLGWAVAAGSCGSLTGATFWYIVGRKIGRDRLRRWVEAHGKWLTLGTDDIDRAQEWFGRHGGAAVFIGRLIPGLRTWISVPAGLNNMGLWPFLLYSAAGTAIWTSVLTWAGYALETSFKQVDRYVGPVSSSLILLIAVWYVWRLFSQRRRSG